MLYSLSHPTVLVSRIVEGLSAAPGTLDEGDAVAKHTAIGTISSDLHPAKRGLSQLTTYLPRRVCVQQ